MNMARRKTGDGNVHQLRGVFKKASSLRNRAVLLLIYATAHQIKLTWNIGLLVLPSGISEENVPI